jgi:hypothetical protein
VTGNRWHILSVIQVRVQSQTFLRTCYYEYELWICYVTTLPVSTAYSVDDWMITEYGAAGWMRIGCTPSKSPPVPLCSSQIPHDLTWNRPHAAAVGSWELTAWAISQAIIMKRDWVTDHISYSRMPLEITLTISSTLVYKVAGCHIWIKRSHNVITRGYVAFPM